MVCIFQAAIVQREPVDAQRHEVLQQIAQAGGVLLNLAWLGSVPGEAQPGLLDHEFANKSALEQGRPLHAQVNGHRTDELRSFLGGRVHFVQIERLDAVRTPIDGKVQVGDVPVVARNVRQALVSDCLLYTSPSPRDRTRSRMPSSA